MTNICSYCGKCIHCAHPYWECPQNHNMRKLTKQELKNIFKDIKEINDMSTGFGFNSKTIYDKDDSEFYFGFKVKKVKKGKAQ